MTLRALLLLILSSCTGCTNVTSGVGGDRTVNGEVWYTKTTSVLFIPVAADVYYCPPHTGHGAFSCYPAAIHDRAAGDLAKPDPIPASAFGGGAEARGPAPADGRAPARGDASPGAKGE